jgi:hypothetical protein
VPLNKERVEALDAWCEGYDNKPDPNNLYLMDCIASGVALIEYNPSVEAGFCDA